ncbi:MAG: hypothetical protein J6J23_01465, partial [Clostridia bacterium]|nr:hypothetical protein [Clostridia bacterium]
DSLDLGGNFEFNLEAMTGISTIEGSLDKSIYKASCGGGVTSTSTITANFTQRVTVQVIVDMTDVKNASQITSIQFSDDSAFNVDANNLTITSPTNGVNTGYTYTEDWHASQFINLYAKVNYASGYFFNVAWGTSSSNAITLSGNIISKTGITRVHSAKNVSANYSDTGSFTPYIITVSEIFQVNMANVFGGRYGHEIGNAGGYGTIVGVPVTDEKKEEGGGGRTVGGMTFSHTSNPGYTSATNVGNTYLTYNPIFNLLYQSVNDTTVSAYYTFIGNAYTDFNFVGWYGFTSAPVLYTADDSTPTTYPHINTDNNRIGLGLTSSSTPSISASSANIVWSAQYTYIYPVFVPETKTITVSTHDGIADGWTFKDSFTNTYLYERSMIGLMLPNHYYYESNGYLSNENIMLNDRVSPGVASATVNVFNGGQAVIGVYQLTSGYSVVGGFIGLDGDANKPWYSEESHIDGVGGYVPGESMPPRAMLFHLEDISAGYAIFIRIVKTSYLPDSTARVHTQESTGAHSSDMATEAGLVTITGKYFDDYGLLRGNPYGNVYQPEVFSNCPLGCASVKVGTDDTFSTIKFNLDESKLAEGWEFIGWFYNQTGTTLISENKEIELSYSTYLTGIGSADGEAKGVYARFERISPVGVHSQVSTGNCSTIGGYASISALIPLADGSIKTIASATNKPESTCTHPEIIVRHSNIISLEAEAKSGYTFIGWFQMQYSMERISGNTDLTYYGYDEFIADFPNGTAYARYIPSPTQIEVHTQLNVNHISDTTMDDETYHFADASATYYDIATGLAVGMYDTTECEYNPATNSYLGCANLYANADIVMQVNYSSANRIFVGWFTGLDGSATKVSSNTRLSYATAEDFLEDFPDGVAVARFVAINEAYAHSQLGYNTDHSNVPGDVIMSGAIYSKVNGLLSTGSSTSNCPCEEMNCSHTHSCAYLDTLTGTTSITFSINYEDENENIRTTTKDGYIFIGFFASKATVDRLDASDVTAGTISSATSTDQDTVIDTITMTLEQYTALMEANNSDGIYARWIEEPVEVDLHAETDDLDYDDQDGRYREVLSHSGTGGYAQITSYQYTNMTNGV